MRAIANLIFVCTLAFTAPALSQAVPDTLRSSSLTRAQESELNRRLALLQNRLGALAGETQLRDAAVRNIAIEIFGASPDLDFETYAGLIPAHASCVIISARRGYARSPIPVLRLCETVRSRRRRKDAFRTPAPSTTS